ncbi:MAG: histidine--tRNA ligase [Eubacteriaceae bacterium]|nr:histidine--tRNA ligase [Eubacteriaceae bacterium]
MPNFTAPKGTNDILPSQTPIWRQTEEKLAAIAASFGYEEIRTPMFEDTNLFARGVGESTDIVTKEMYTFLHRGKESLTLRPEGTAPVIRSYIENGMHSDAQPVKLYYLNPTFRAENPQKGRYRQFHQFGAEGIGSYDPSMDAEIIMLGKAVFDAFKIDSVTLYINSVGCPKCRESYYDTLRAFLSQHIGDLCEDCKSRLGKNPMRVLDCKNENCQKLTQNAPVMLDYLCSECESHFEKLAEYLAASSVEYTVDPKIVRGLDYYTKTAFEFKTDKLGSQSAVCAGGRYDGLSESLGGPPAPGIGFGLGIERLLLLADLSANERYTDIYFAPTTDEARLVSFKLAAKARSLGKTVQTDTMQRSLKAQMKFADKIGSVYVAILTEETLKANSMTIRNMLTKEQFDIAIVDLEKIWEK